eukprot:2787980-Pleurochrysis_carterae.AAC.1
MEAGDKHVSTKFNTIDESNERMSKAASDYKEIPLKMWKENVNLLGENNLRTLCATNERCRFFASYFREVVFGFRSEDFLVGERCQFSNNTAFFKNGDIAIVCAYDKSAESINVTYHPNRDEFNNIMAAYIKQMEIGEKLEKGSKS